MILFRTSHTFHPSEKSETCIYNLDLQKHPMSIFAQMKLTIVWCKRFFRLENVNNHHKAKWPVGLRFEWKLGVRCGYPIARSLPRNSKRLLLQIHLKDSRRCLLALDKCLKAPLMLMFYVVIVFYKD